MITRPTPVPTTATQFQLTRFGSGHTDPRLKHNAKLDAQMPNSALSHIGAKRAVQLPRNSQLEVFKFA
jgi:hypothetical protein